ncbi:MAG: glycosyltransferase family 39 protein [Anaerolineaceae bacterium]|nr:glycosyltransferase family 39 protein [Anaerolineaceae bacterium]
MKQHITDFGSPTQSHIIPLIILIGLTLGATLVHLDTYPASWLDEGFTLNAAVTLVETGQYGTLSYQGVKLFDASISSGSPLVLPIALSVSLLGNGLVQARLIVVLCTIVTVVCLYFLSERLYGGQIALWITTFVLAFPTLSDVGLLLLGRQILGEVPAFMFGLIAILLWLRDWSSETVVFALASGLFAGLGFLTKFQVIIPFLPAVIFIAILRAIQRKGHLLRLLLPVIGAVGVYLAWIVFTQALSPADVRWENSVISVSGIQIHFFTNLRGSTLSRGMYIILAIPLIGLGDWFRRAYKVVGTVAPDERDKHWLEATLAVYVGFSVIWVYIFSIGWPRYIFGALMISLLLVGRTLYGLLFAAVCKWSIPEKVAKRVYIISLGALLIFGFFTNVLPTLTYDEPAYDEMMIAYIDQRVDRSAVVETWEWQITGRGLHRNYHMPHQLVMWKTLRQRSENQSYAFNYDLLQASPDYLLIGPFASWVGIYDTPEREANFEMEIQFGTYALMRRVN